MVLRKLWRLLPRTPSSAVMRCKAAVPFVSLLQAASVLEPIFEMAHVISSQNIPD